MGYKSFKLDFSILGTAKRFRNAHKTRGFKKHVFNYEPLPKTMAYIINFSSFSNSLFSRASEFGSFVKNAKVELTEIKGSKKSSINIACYNVPTPS